MTRLSAFLGLVLLASPVFGRGAEDPSSLLQRFDLRLPQSRESAARALATLGPDAMPRVFALISSAAEGPRDESLARSFVYQPQAQLRGLFCSFTRSALPVGRRAPALLVMSQSGGVPEVERCLDVAGAGGGDLQPELVHALAAIFARDSDACEHAFTIGRTIALPEGENLARALAASHSGAAARALVRLANARPTLSPIGFSCLLAEAEALPRPVDPDLLGVVRELLGHEDHPAAQELCLLAGRFEDDDSVPVLIERISSQQASLRSNALWSLHRITGLGLGPDAKAWGQWYQDETKWWGERSAAVFARLHSPDAGAQRRALGELGARFWRRAQVSAELSEFLGRAERDGARMACGLLARLGCKTAAPALEARLEDSDDTVRESARAALASLGGKKVPARKVGLPATARAQAAR
ncbi:MAG: hypothetical protein IPJ19_21550 [Planctomycetes bacterium]|nr:hypothetical protein [Planctomycetota bacterium]